MSVVVLSCGRTGTNVALEILRGSKVLSASNNVEDKDLFKRGIEYSENYLTKMDTHYIEFKDFRRLMEENPKMKIIWTIRDPRDTLMCKIFRGQPNTEGRGNWTADDGTIEGGKKDMDKMVGIYKQAIEEYPDRVKLIRLEDMVSETEKTSKVMCEFIGIEYEETMIEFPSRMRNVHKAKRYGNTIDKKVALWEDWETTYDGFFSKNNYDQNELFGSVNNMVKYFKY